MGAFFTRFIQEHFDPAGRLERYTYTYDDNFNYGYDVVETSARPTGSATVEEERLSALQVYLNV